MRISRLPAILILAGVLSACSAGSGESVSPNPKLNTGLDKTTSQTANQEIDGIASYFLREQNNQSGITGTEMVHSIEIQGPLAEKYFVRFCYQGNCWGNADFRILCARSSSCELQIADRTNPGQYLEADGSEVQILHGTDSKKNVIEFVDPFFNRLEPNFVYQVWSMDGDGKKSLEIISKLSAE